MGSIRNWWSRQTQRNQIALGAAVGTGGVQLFGWLADRAATLAWEKFLESFLSAEWAAKMNAVISGTLNAISGVLNDPRVSWALFGGLIVALAILIIPITVRKGRSILPNKKSSVLALARPSRTESGEQEVIPVELRVWGTRTRDGIDIEPQIIYRNRSRYDIKVKPESASYILEGKEPDGSPSRGFQGDLKRESNGEVSFNPVRLHAPGDRPGGMVAIDFAYGPKDGELKTKLGINYIFTILSMPKDERRRIKLRVDATENVNYADI